MCRFAFSVVIVGILVAPVCVDSAEFDPTDRILRKAIDRLSEY
jgi:hypothetical protein